MAPPKRVKLASPTSAILYLRVSSKQQAESGLGAEAQEAVCRERCAREGWDVAGMYYDPAMKGKDPIEGRPGLQAALVDVGSRERCAFVVYSLSRLVRSQRLLWRLLDDYALPLVSATEAFETATPSGRAFIGMLGVFAQLESDMCAERTRDALAAAKARGVRLGQRPVADAVSPEALARARVLKLEGRSLLAIASTLNSEGLLSPLGKRWHPRTVSLLAL